MTPQSESKAGEAGILFDGCEGEWEECAYVPVEMAHWAWQARKLLMREAGFILEPEFYIPEPEPPTCFMRPTEWIDEPGEVRFTPCNRDHPEAVEFWRCYYEERNWRLPGWPVRLWRGLLHYRHRRGIGQSRRKAFGSVRIHLRPHWFFRAKRRIRAAISTALGEVDDER